ncbi:MAG: hypothetical protein HRU46_02620 [Verrucomicrobiales bacterium]|nr:hypothetical protein [Verrucomicrobiales bacterium]
MSKRTLGCLGIGIGIYAVLSAVLITVVLLHHEDFHSPPAESRSAYGYTESRLGLFKDFSTDVEQQRPAAEEMDIPNRWEGKGDSFVVEWEDRKILDPGVAPDPWLDELADDQEVEFIAYGIWVPQPDDPLNDEDWRPRPTFRTADGSTVLSDEDLAELGVPEALLSLPAPSDYHTPRLSLLLRTKNFEYVRFNDVRAGDQRTGAKVTYDLESLGEQDRSDTEGEWTRLDAALLLWHDTPLTVKATVLTGEASTQEIQTRLGEQIVFGDRLRIQWIGSTKDDPSVNNYISDFTPAKSVPPQKAKQLKKHDPYSGSTRRANIFQIRAEAKPPLLPSLVVRASSNDYLQDHCGLVTEDGIEWDWDYDEEDDDMYFASLNVPAPKDKATFVFIPNTTILEFEIPALPDMPNHSDPEDLFDITLPRITLGSDRDETQFLGYIAVASQVGWDTDTKWKNHPPKNMPLDNTFRNESPQTLMNWYLDNTPTSHVRFDESMLVLHINEEKDSWWDSVVAWFQAIGGF